MSQYFRKYIKKDHYPVHHSQIKFKTFFNNCIQTSLLQRNYKQTQDDDWDIYWCQKHLISQTLDRVRLYPNKRVNHFRNFYEICRKDLLSKNIKRYRKGLEKQGKTQQAAGYSYLPLTYNLPSQYPIFNEQYKRVKDKQKSVWIMKPIGLSQGKGIFLFRNISDIQQWSQMKNQAQAYIVQRYIHNPLLIGNKKFDLRIYVLVTSHNNLTIYLYRSGFGRFTHYRYDSIDINSMESHLTNVAIQKNTDNYDDQRGGKYQLNKLKVYMLSKFGQVQTNNCFYEIQQLIIKTLQATAKLIISDKRCFQLYGFDILIDSNLKPWLIQINGSPSMTANTQSDKIMKTGLLDDVLTIVNVQQLLVGDQKRIGGFDLICKDNKRVKIFMNSQSPLITEKDKQKQKQKQKKQVKPLGMSMLGCINDRLHQMRKLAKVVALKQAQKPKQQSQNTNNNENNKRNRSTYNTNNNNNSGNSSNAKNYGNQSLKSRNDISNNNVKLPKVIPSSNSNNGGGSNKLIPGNDTPNNNNVQVNLNVGQKKGNQMYRITNSKESKRS